MDRDQLRELQAPLKARYRGRPGRCAGDLAGRGSSLDPAEVACSVATGRALVPVGLHPASGGDGLSACSGGMLWQALVACAGVTMRSVATSMQLEVTGTVRAEGDLDFRGTLGVDQQAPVGFRTIRLAFELESGATAEQLAALARLTERCCVVHQTQRADVPVTVSVAGP